MIVSFLVPRVPAPIGGITTVWEYAQGLGRLGHEVHVVHVGYPERGFEVGLDEIDWFAFTDDAQHHVLDEWDESKLPEAEVAVCTLYDAPADRGLPVWMFSGRGMTPVEIEERLLAIPGPKVCPSRWLREVAIRAGVPDRSAVHVPYGIDHEKYHVTRPLEDRPPRVAALSHVHPAKGTGTALKVLRRVKEAVPDAQAVLFGTHPPRLEPGDEWIEVVVDPSQEQLVHDVYNGSAVFLGASRVEGFGLTSPEAMACGCALVQRQNGGSADYAFDGETALVAPLRDVDLLADHVIGLLRDDARRLALARSGHAYVQQFRWDLASRLLADVIERYRRDPELFPAGRHIDLDFDLYWGCAESMGGRLALDVDRVSNAAPAGARGR